MSYWKTEDQYEIFIEVAKGSLNKAYRLIEEEENNALELCGLHEYCPVNPIVVDEARCLSEACAGIDMALEWLERALASRKEWMAKLEEYR